MKKSTRKVRVKDGINYQSTMSPTNQGKNSKRNRQLDIGTSPLSQELRRWKKNQKMKI